MLYIARDGVGNITAICDNPNTVENLRALIDDNIEEVPTAGVAEDYVYAIDGKAGSQHIDTMEGYMEDVKEAAPAAAYDKIGMVGN